MTMVLTFTSVAYGNDNEFNYEKITDKSLEDILEDIEFAITEHNLRIVDRLHIGQAIKARGNIDFPDYEIFLYCNLTFAKNILELDPALINACPGRVTVRSAGNYYIISAPLWPENSTDLKLKKLMFNMNNIVRKIVDYAALDWLEINEK
jgi:uncharacterized protein (DUF302 family)